MKSIQYVEKIRKFNRYYSNVLGKIDQEIYKQPFPLIEARIIAELYYRNGCIATEIRENLGVDRGYMSRIIQHLEGEKVLIKKQSIEDKRQYSLHLTDYGKEIFEEMVERANRELTNMIHHLSKQEASMLVASMEKIESIYSKKDFFPSEISIRPFQAGDIGYVSYLHGQFYNNEPYKFRRIFEYYVMKGLTEFIYNPDGGELWVAEVNGEIAGSIAITKASDTVAQLRWFILNDHYQGRGIGKKLIETALNFSKEQNYQHVFLWTITTLDAARHLYKKYNFRPTEEKINEEWSGKPIIEERWDLDLFVENNGL